MQHFSIYCTTPISRQVGTKPYACVNFYDKIVNFYDNLLIFMIICVNFYDIFMIKNKSFFIIKNVFFIIKIQKIKNVFLYNTSRH